MRPEIPSRKIFSWETDGWDKRSDSILPMKESD